jgi:Transposase DDE domain
VRPQTPDRRASVLDCGCPLAAFKSRRPLQKRQVVVGLLTDSQGEPVSIQVYRGNTSDLKTFGQQVHKIKKELGCEGVTLVGDRGMIRTAQKAAAQKADFHFITALTQPQIRKLLAQKVSQQECVSVAVAKKLDWQDFMAGLSKRAQGIIHCLVEGKPLASLARRRHMNTSTLLYHKRRLGDAVLEHFGKDIIPQVLRKPNWKDSLDATGRSWLAGRNVATSNWRAQPSPAPASSPAAVKGCGRRGGCGARKTVQTLFLGIQYLLTYHL